MPMQPAVLGTARLGNFRLGYEPAALVTLRRAHVTILLAGVAAQVRIAGLTIRDLLNDAPNTATLTIDDATPPTVEQSLRITVNSDTPRLLFAGNLQTVGLSYEGLPAQRVWPSSAIDTTARANRRRPFGTYVSVSATTIAQALVSGYAPAFSTTNIAAGLPAVSIIFDGTEDWITALARLAKAIGGYCKVEDLDAYLFLTDTTDPPDAIDDTAGRFLDDPPITMTSDVSQLRTRVCGKGHGEKTLVDVAAGETTIPIADAVMFNPAGGKAIIGTTPDGAQSQIVDYTGVILGTAGGVIVGPGAAPSTAPSLALAAGAGLGSGVYQYAYTMVTPAGESLPSPIASVTTGAVTAAPTSAITVSPPTAGTPFMDVGTHDYVLTFTTALGETTPGPISASVTATATNQVGVINTVPLGPAGVTGRKIYRRFNGAGTFKLDRTIANNTSTGPFGDGIANAALGAAAPAVNTTAGNQVSVSAIGIGASPTTSRKLYRTVVGGSQLKLLTTIADDTTTVFADSTADGSLGANAPISDASGLVQAYGQVNAGSTSILTTGTGPLPASGWAITQSGDLFRYTGISGNMLTGIPASGVGALLTTVFYGDPILPAPALTGVTGLTLAALAGTPVSIWVQRDDLAAQAAQAAIDLVNAPQTTPVTAPTTAPTVTPSTGSGIDTGVHQWAVSFGSVLGETLPSPIASATVGSTVPAPTIAPTLNSLTLGSTFPAGAVFQWATTWVTASGETTPSATFSQTLSLTGYYGPISIFAQSSFSAPPASATGRNLYRTTNGGSQLKLVGAFSGLSAATLFNDSTPDGSLGANAPTVNTASAGNQAALSGMPIGPTGTTSRKVYRTVAGGSQLKLQQTIANNTATTGVTDATPDASLGANAPTSDTAGLLGPPPGYVADGIYEGPPIVDERRGEASLTALCDANLQLFSTPIVTVTYATHDQKTKSGKTVHVATTTPPIGPVDLVIQDVTITEIGTSPSVGPTFTVTASSTRFSLDDLLRRLLAASA